MKPPLRHPLLRFASWIAHLVPGPLRSVFYRLGPVTRLLRRTLNLAAPAGLTEVTVAAGQVAGARLALDLQAEKDYWLGTYEQGVLAALERAARPDMVAYDVGANIGYLTIFLARQVGAGGKVFAFEALPQNLDRLREHKAMNQMENVEIVPRAVTDRQGPIEFFVGPSGGMGKAEGSAGRADGYEETLTVDGLSLDHFVFNLRQPAPGLVKMDIEGGEGRALAGMKRILAEAQPEVFLEIHGPESARDCWAVLDEAGYSMFSIQKPGKALMSVDELDWKSYLWARPGAHG